MSEVFEGYAGQYYEISAAHSRKCATASTADDGTHARPPPPPLSLARTPGPDCFFCILVSSSSLPVRFTREEAEEVV